MVRRFVLGVAMFLAALLVAAGQPAAAEPQVEVRTPDNVAHIQPEVEAIKVPFTVIVHCDTLSAYPGVTTIRAAVEDPPDFVSAMVHPPSRSFTETPDYCTPPAGQERELAYNLTLTATRLAPAFEHVDLQVNVTVVQGHDTYGPFQGDLTVQPGYVSVVEALAVDPAIRVPAGGEGRFWVDVRNLGNGATRVESELVYLSEERLSAAIPPAPFVLESEATAGPAAKDEKRVFVSVRMPRSGPSDVLLRLTMTGTYAGSLPDGYPHGTDEVELMFSVQRGGPDDPGDLYDAASPAPAAWSFLVAMVAALVLRRRPSSSNG